MQSSSSLAVRRAMVWIGLGVVAAVAAAASWTHDAYSAHSAQAARRSSPPQRLNVVLILSDDQRAAGTGAVMHDVHDLLAEHGVTFTDAHVTTSECGPSRASILSGEYSHHTGVLDNFGPNSYPAFNESSDLATWLHAAGYQTALVGKYLNDYTKYGNNAIPPGWDNWQALDSVPMEAYYNYDLNQNGRIVHYGSRPADYSTTVLTTKALDFIHHARRPFFLYFAPVTPHLPAIPAKQDQGKLENLAPLHSPAFDERNISDKPWSYWHRDLLKAAAQIYVNDVRRRQLESLLSLDRSVKQIVDALKARHELDRTVIVYTSDNGFLWGEHRLGGKLWPYEDSTHVPLVVRTPWQKTPSTSNEQILNVDLASTIAAIAHVRPQLPQDGRSFLPFLHGRTVPWRHSFLLEYLGAVHFRRGGPPRYHAIQTRRYLYVEYENGWRELYDLRSDPWELRNVANTARYAAAQRVLHLALHRLDTAPAGSPGATAMPRA